MPRPVLVAEPAAGLPGRPADLLPALAHLAGGRRLTALAGSWSGTSVLVAADPAEVVERHDVPTRPELAALLDRTGPLPSTVPTGSAVGGGWSVLLGHALGRSTGRVRTPPAPRTGPRLPELVLSRYDHLLRHDGTRWWTEALDEGDGVATARARDLAAEAASAWARWREAPRGPGAVRLVAAPDAAAHMAAVEHVVGAVRAGEIAQANVCGRFALRLDDGGPAAVHAWATLVRALSPGRAALVTGPWGALVGASPETYLSVRDDRVTSSPIKGTRPAGEGGTLRRSAKDTSENVMIVDLVRNDLARVCVPGTVTVEELLAVQAMTGVSHLVSRVAGTLEPGTGPGDLVARTFPPGSVTGTPKQRATEVTDTVEVAARGAHTGAVGFLGPRLADLAVTIRSLEVGADGTAALGVGGGIVADSTPAEEWHEVLTKAAPLLTALGAAVPVPGPTTAAAKGLADPAHGLIETVLAVDGRAVAAPDHAARLRRSVWELTGVPLEADVEGLLGSAARDAGPGAHRLRVRVDLAGRGPATSVEESAGTRTVRAAGTRVETEPWRLPVAPWRQPGLVLGAVPAPGAGLERHKYADRSFLDRALADARRQAPAGSPAPDDVAFEAHDGLLETTRACLVAVMTGPDGPSIVTPACDGRVLPGTTRQVLLDLARQQGWQVRLAALDAEVLAGAEGLLACGSLRGAEWVSQVGPHRWAGPSTATAGLGAALLRRWGVPAG
ncbi:chorismate-binding protein [Aquipuribacter hungaricus]|uniref:Chorismate-binding protein n=2 Tax=Aquipuribacter hungaricus TaxID=545624 RepID=A0ABV7WFA0_9MICO